MFLMSATDRVYNALRECEALSDCVVIKAYPYAKKPTRLRRTVLTVSPDKTELKNISLGGESAQGTFSVAVDIFTPQESGSPAANAVCDKTAEALMKLKPTGVEISAFSREDDLGAYRAKLTAVFSGNYGREAGE